MSNVRRHIMGSESRSNQALIEGYFASFTEGGDGPNAWAYEEMLELQHSNPERAWELTLSILRVATDPLYKAFVAAGPLEDLLASHGSQFITRVEALASAESWFLEALHSVYRQASGVAPAGQSCRWVHPS
jgi:hypothetical protein